MPPHGKEEGLHSLNRGGGDGGVSLFYWLLQPPCVGDGKESGSYSMR